LCLYRAAATDSQSILMILKTQAIPLRIYPFSETSRVVVWLTPDYGRLTTLIKGALRPKSPFLGQYDFYYTCELLFYARFESGLHIASECSPLNERRELRSRWKSAVCASYMSELISRIALVEVAHAESPARSHAQMFRMLDAALDFFSVHTPSTAHLCWFELKFMDRCGLAPRLGDCLKCRQVLLDDSGSAPILFSAKQGGVFCRSCMASPQDPHDQLVTRDILAMLRFWQASRSPHAAHLARCTERHTERVNGLLGAFLRYHLDMDARPRDVVTELLRIKNPAPGKAGAPDS